MIIKIKYKVSNENVYIHILFNIVKTLLNENKKINGKNNKKRIEKDIVIFHKISCRL